MSTLSRTENSVLMAQARESLRGKWGLAMAALAVVLVIEVAVQYIPRAGGILFILISGPLSVGVASFFLALSRRQETRLSQVFDGFRNFGVALGAYLLQWIFVALWLLLLIVPGVIAAFSYSLTYFIIAEDESIGPLEAISKSKEMMKGNKWKMALLSGRFLGWILLCLLTLGVGFLWLGPYLFVTTAKFYEDVKGGGPSPDEARHLTQPPAFETGQVPGEAA